MSGLQVQLTEDDAGAAPAAGELLPELPAEDPRVPWPPDAVLPFPASPRPARANGGTSTGTIALPAGYDPVEPSAFRVAIRLFQLVAVIAYLAVAKFFDWLFWGRGQENREALLLERQAIRLREVLQGLGGTFVKVGQQMSIRTDVFHPIYCHELEKLLDDAEPIPFDYVREVFERQTGKSLAASFAFFDETPVGKASIACVYRAELQTGEAVAVKVRRPHIKRHFRTDLAALNWVLRTAEFLTILRPRVSVSFRTELELMLMEEVDFHLEMRYQELFRRYFKKRKKLNTTAPKVYFRLCGPDVLVTEFVTGVWMKDVMAHLDDEGYLEWLRDQDIDPKRVAKQLVRASHYGFFECPFFHGDPHPGNILVQPGNRIVMVDFGACGVFAKRERIQLAQMHYYHSQEDVGGMVQCVIQLMEPLPPIDLDELRRRLENEWWKGFYGIKSRHAGWQERTSFRLWTALFREVRRFQIPMPLNVLRMIRATLLYDSVAARIYPRIDVFKEYGKYFDGYARHVQRQMQESFLRQLFCGPDPVQYVRLRRFIDVGELALRWAQSFLRRPLPDFAALVSKGYEIFMAILKWIFTSASISVAALGVGIWVAMRRAGTIWLYPGEFLAQLKHDLTTPGAQASEVIFGVWLGLMFLVTVKYLHQMWFRMRDKDVGKGITGTRR
ncbi:MAG TPA: AarF/UbiB family protein [Thermoanaerobaculia bacterium]|jgi:ubiquinone biosynthesis protein|nr:AarF/UbiB family protein [Thermoanaerobaculia bacterium]